MTTADGLRAATAVVALSLVAAIGTAAPAAAQITPGAEVEALIGLNWPDPEPLGAGAGGLSTTLRPLVTATATTELSITDLGHRSALTRGRLTYGGRPAGAPLRVAIAGGASSSLLLAVPALMAEYPGGGITGRPAELTLTRPGPSPAGTPDPLDLLISLTSGP